MSSQSRSAWTGQTARSALGRMTTGTPLPSPAVRRAPRPALAPSDSSTAVVVKRICSTSRPTSAARLSPLAASSNSARSRVPARSRGQRTAIRISVANGLGAGRRGVAVRRAARKIAVTAGSAAGEAKPLWRCLCAIADARRLSAPALSVFAPSVKKAATVVASVASGTRLCSRHQSSNALQSAA